jgi:hypothetical protein
MPAIRFDFEDRPDNLGHDVLRPVVKIRIESAPLGTGQMFLVDTGSPDTCIAWDEAERAGMDPRDGDPIDLPADFAVGAAPVTEARGFHLNCWIEGDRHFIRLQKIPVLFIKPWDHPGFRGVLGTRAMDSIRMEISVSGRWLRVTSESEVSPRVEG